MSLDPQVEAHYKGKSMKNAIGVVPIEELRRMADSVYNDKTRLTELPFVCDEKVDGRKGEIPVRIYCPQEKSPLPVMLYFHGGAFVMHNIASHDNLCRKLAAECGCIVISVGYSLAPEHPYPAALLDAVDVLSWASAHAAEYGGDPERIITAGDSAGATISAALCFYTKDHNGPKIALQVLYYGTYGCLSLDESESVRLYADGHYVLPREMLEAASGLYGGGKADEKDPYYNPGQREDCRMETKTLLVTAEYDPLRDDGEAFAGKLKEAGDEVILFRMTGMMHGFMLLWNEFDRTEEVFRLTAKAVNSL